MKTIELNLNTVFIMYVKYGKDLPFGVYVDSLRDRGVRVK